MKLNDSPFILWWFMACVLNAGVWTAALSLVAIAKHFKPTP